MPNRPSTRVALVAGATGLIGRALLSLLQQSPRYGHVHVLARRPMPGTPADARTTVHSVDFTRLPEPLPAVDDVYIALGTTIKVAGSQAAFRAVDFDHVVAIARAGRAAGGRRLAVVSALGANPKSPVFYNRVKGETEAAIADLDYETIVIAQPSLLLGDRVALGQPARSAELVAARLLGPVMWLIPRGVRPIAASAVAAAMLTATLEGEPGVQRLSSAQMQAAGARR